ncbi:MAG: hypothetical protein Q9191_007461, partial [Dirinaria sp. TL-2023a]
MKSAQRAALQVNRLPMIGCAFANPKGYAITVRMDAGRMGLPHLLITFRIHKTKQDEERPQHPDPSEIYRFSIQIEINVVNETPEGRTYNTRFWDHSTVDLDDKPTDMGPEMAEVWANALRATQGCPQDRRNKIALVQLEVSSLRVIEGKVPPLSEIRSVALVSTINGLVNGIMLPAKVGFWLS